MTDTTLTRSNSTTIRPGDGCVSCCRNHARREARRAGGNCAHSEEGVFLSSVRRVVRHSWVRLTSPAHCVVSRSRSVRQGRRRRVEGVCASTSRRNWRTLALYLVWGWEVVVRVCRREQARAE